MKLERHQHLPQPIEIQEFAAIADRTYRPENPSSAWAVRDALLALAQNKEAIWHLLAAAVEEWLQQNLPAEQASYYILYRGRTYSIRATIWLPESRVSEMAKLQNGVFAYDYPHNHNFDLVTVGCFGPGYETDIYSIGALDSQTRVGDLVDAEFLGRHRLSPGTVLFYEAFDDVHIQVPVDELSVALNFLPRSPLHRERPQHAFEVVGPNTLRVSGTPLCEEAREIWAMRLLGKLHHAGFGVGGSLQRMASERGSAPAAVFARGVVDGCTDARRIHDEVVGALRGGASANYRRIAGTVRQQRGANDVTLDGGA